MAWFGRAGDMAGGWHTCGFESRTPTHDKARPGGARPGEAGLGEVRKGTGSRVDGLRRGSTPRHPRTTWLGVAWRGTARHGPAGQGKEGEWTTSEFESQTPPRGAVWQCGAWSGVAKWGAERQGMGTAGGWQAQGFKPPASTHGMDRLGRARFGAVRQDVKRHGMARQRRGKARGWAASSHPGARPGRPRTTGTARQNSVGRG